MSLINDALKKAQKEKGASGPVPPDQPFESPPLLRPKMKPKRVLFLVGIGVIGIGLGMAVILAGIFTVAKQKVPQKTTFPAPVAEEKSAPPSQISEAPEETLSPAISTPPPQPEKVVPASPSPTPSIALQSSLVLNGIVQGEGENLAVINNQITRIGDEIGEAVLLEIGRDFVILEDGEKRFQLKMK